ncbi:MAG: FIST C-terminal domain-containing protein [Trichocoleus desertorum ATA4-8-CV12]|jgi:small ligand-binding sensory domain FIST|nr:FIST C-terminal domain-containing protein [Trichocoleus desertorum ATA4-8-CV12]
MKWANALSTRSSLEAAIEEVVERAQESLGVAANFGILFISAAFASEYSRLMPLLQERLSVPTLIGCSGGGIIGVDSEGEAQEVEVEPALSLSLAYLPEVKIHAFHLTGEELPDLDSSPDAWVKVIGVLPEEEPDFILLADLMSSKINDLLQGLDFAYPGSIKVGGLASANAMGGNNGLFCNYQLQREGIVGVALSGKIVVETIVAQGCRPIGPVYRVTEGERNILLGLEAQTDSDLGASNGKGRTPLTVLQELIQDMSEEDRSLAQHSLFVGIARNAFKQTLEQGDFLIRQVLGVDPRVGAIAIGDRVRSGQRIQFHLRDAEASAEDLRKLLERYCKQNSANSTSEAALMFSCLGRGEGLYGEPNFDSHLFSRYFGNVPLSGFFCNGEIGPIADNTFLHGYTSVFGILRNPNP